MYNLNVTLQVYLPLLKIYFLFL